MNLLSSPIISINGGQRLSLPALFTAMTRGEVLSFPALRPHQRPAWHMFLVQLGALAAWKSGAGELPDNEDDWARLLRALTPDYGGDEPWRLLVNDIRKPAFMQPPLPKGEELSSDAWANPDKIRRTPDGVDMLVTSKNHDVKKAVAKDAQLEDWVFALISLQTCEGVMGMGNKGIARMNGGYGSRPMLCFAPAQKGGAAPHPSKWWAADAGRLLESRRRGDIDHVGIVGGNALLWCVDWGKGAEGALRLDSLDPWFIEVCRRVRLLECDGAVIAKCGTSDQSRIDKGKPPATPFDPWTPVHKVGDKAGMQLTIGSRVFDYRLLSDLLFFGNYVAPMMASEMGESDDGWVLVAEAFGRGQGKTEGFKSKVIPAPSRFIRLLAPGSPSADLAKAQINEIEAFNGALRSALSLAAADGFRDKREKSHYACATPARRRFDIAADREFFPSLWRRLEAHDADEGIRAQAQMSFLEALMREAKAAFDAFLPTAPCKAIYRARAQTMAQREFYGHLRRNDAVRILFRQKEGADER